MFVFTYKLQKRMMHSYNVTIFSAFLINSKSGFNLICISALHIILGEYSPCSRILHFQRCDPLHRHEECWDSVPPSVVVFSWARPQPYVANVPFCIVGPWPLQGNSSGILLTTGENHENPDGNSAKDGGGSFDLTLFGSKTSALWA